MLTNAAPNFNIANFYSKENLRRLEKSARQLEKGNVIEINFDKLRKLENRGYKFADKLDKLRKLENRGYKFADKRRLKF